MKTFREFKTVDEAKKTFDRFYSYFSIIDKNGKRTIDKTDFSDGIGERFEYSGNINFSFEGDSNINLFVEIIDKTVSIGWVWGYNDYVRGKAFIEKNDKIAMTLISELFAAFEKDGFVFFE